jgi:4-hydroxybenzoate polyprenyltransferase
MYREFFIRDWLRRHLFWYGLIHMLVLSFIDFTILQMADAQGPLAHDPAYFLFAFLSFFMTFSLEVARKIRVPEAERDEVDTYSKVVGVGGAMILSWSFQAAVLLIAWQLRGPLQLPSWFFLLSGLGWLVVGSVHLLWFPRLSAARSLKLDKVASVFYLAFYLGLAGTLVSRVAGWGG